MLWSSIAATAFFTVAFAGPQDRLNPEDEGDPRIDPDGTDGWVRLDLDLEGPLGVTRRQVRKAWNAARAAQAGLDSFLFGQAAALLRRRQIGGLD